jgi:hypothetical protein
MQSYGKGLSKDKKIYSKVLSDEDAGAGHFITSPGLDFIKTRHLDQISKWLMQ